MEYPEMSLNETTFSDIYVPGGLSQLLLVLLTHSIQIPSSRGLTQLMQRQKRRILDLCVTIMKFKVDCTSTSGPSL